MKYPTELPSDWQARRNHPHNPTDPHESSASNLDHYHSPTAGQHVNVAQQPTKIGNIAYIKGQIYKWSNPHGLSIPVITFDPNCKKCHGSGVSKSRFSGTLLPCTRCYTRHGYCKKCYGTGVNYRKNKVCTKFQAGKRLKNNSSSSSESD